MYGVNTTEPDPDRQDPQPRECRGLPAGGVGVSLQLSPYPQKGCRGLPAGGLGVFPNSPPPPQMGCRGLPAGGLGVSPNLALLSQLEGAGAKSLLGVWGCPPI